MIEAWIYIVIIAPAIVITLTVVFVRLSQRDGREIARMRREVIDLRRRSLDASIRPTHGQATAQSFDLSAGSEAYQRAAARSHVTY